MNKEKEIECISRLIKISLCFDELIDFLLNEKIVSHDDIKSINLELNKANFLHDALRKAQKTEKIILLQFEWIILPIERIKITIVTERDHKTFSFNY